MKIYIQDNGYRGCQIVVAENEQQAREFLKENSEYEENNSVDEFEIKPGFVYDCMGDR